MKVTKFILVLTICFSSSFVMAGELPDTLERAKSALVATYSAVLCYSTHRNARNLSVELNEDIAALDKVVTKELGFSIQIKEFSLTSSGEGDSVTSVLCAKIKRVRG